MDVVVVLPWVPAMATAVRPAITEARAAARGMIRSPCLSASPSSGLESRIAVETTTVSTSLMWEAAWPMCTVAPSSRSSVISSELRASLPVTRTPRLSRMRAMPDMPAPPTPMKCTRPSSSTVTGSTSLTRLIGLSPTLSWQA